MTPSRILAGALLKAAAAASAPNYPYAIAPKAITGGAYGALGGAGLGLVSALLSNIGRRPGAQRASYLRRMLGGGLMGGVAGSGFMGLAAMNERDQVADRLAKRDADMLLFDPDATGAFRQQLKDRLSLADSSWLQGTSLRDNPLQNRLDDMSALDLRAAFRGALAPHYRKELSEIRLGPGETAKGRASALESPLIRAKELEGGRLSLTPADNAVPWMIDSGVFDR